MANGINRAIIIGNLGADPEIRYTQAGAAVANISVATSESWKDKQTGERQEKTEWHKVAMFGPTAEVAGKYLGKGSKVYIEGRIQTRKWQGKDGNDRYTTEIVANEMQMLDSKGGTPASTPAQSAPAPAATPAPAGQDDDFQDEIPF